MKLLTYEAHIERSSRAELEDAIEAFQDWLAVEGEAPLLISDVPNKYYLATLTNAAEDDNYRGFAIYTLEWTCQPYMMDASITTETWVSGVSTNHTWSPDVLMYLHPVVTITPTNGTLTGFTLNANGEVLTYTGTLASGASLTINGICTVVVAGVNTDTELTGAYNPGSLVMAFVEGNWPILSPGITNSFLFNKTGGTATQISITVKYRKRYRR